MQLSTNKYVEGAHLYAGHPVELELNKRKIEFIMSEMPPNNWKLTYVNNPFVSMIIIILLSMTYVY